jgi:hypothetical protein
VFKQHQVQQYQRAFRFCHAAMQSFEWGLAWGIKEILRSGVYPAKTPL